MNQKTFYLILCLLFVISLSSQTTIPSNFYGLNGWMPDTIGNSSSPGPSMSFPAVPTTTLPAGKLYKLKQPVKDIGAKMLRYGGINHDVNLPTLAQYKRFVRFCRDSAKAEPVIQISFANEWWILGANAPLSAASNGGYQSYITKLVDSLKVAPFNVKYFSIGNEPNAYTNSPYNVAPSNSITPGNLSSYFQTLSNVVKTADPSAIVIGPDLSYLQSAYLNGVITNTGGITANGTAGTPYCDIFAYHTYPNDSTWSRAQIIAHPSNSFASELGNIRTKLSSAPNGSKIKIALTEMNLSWRNHTPNRASGTSDNSFLAGQWTAEMYATALSTSTIGPVAFMMPWGLQESGGDSSRYDLSLLNGSSTSSPRYRSTYVHAQMMAEGFGAGTFFMATPSSTTQLVKAWSAHDCGHLAVMVINQDSLNPHTVTISHGTVMPGTYSDVGMKLNITPTPSWSNFTISIGAQETQMLVFDACHNLRKQYVYNLASATSHTLPTTTSTTTTRFCQCFKTVASAFPNYGLRCAVSTETGTVHYNTYTLSADTRIKDSAYVTGSLTVPSGHTLTIDTAEVTFAGGAKIVVQSGGKLIITGSSLHGCADQGSSKWSGIQVSDANTTPQFTMTTSSLDGATLGVGVQQGYLPVITNNVFTNCGIGIKLNKTKGFTITGNEFSSVPVCIKTASTISTSASISENLFYQPDTTIIFKDDDHSQLSISCNGFAEYTSYGIYATGGALQSQGSSGTGAGNFFSSASTYTNNQLYYTGSGMTYYCDPSNTFTLAGSSGGITLTASVSTASADGSCDQIDNKLAAHGITKNGNQGTTAAGAIASSQGAGAANTASQLLDCRPNPASGRITFVYSLADRTKPAELWIRNLMGETVNKLTLPAASQSVETDLSAMGNGIYFYSLVIDGNIIASKKLVISK